MRQVIPDQLWLGTAIDAENLSGLHDAGVKAVVSLALEELPTLPSREIVFCRFPLIDGAGNSLELLRLAVNTAALLVARNIRTLINCSVGMSRSPAIAAVAMAVAQGQSPDDCLEKITADGPCDVSPALWADVKRVFASKYQS